MRIPSIAVLALLGLSLLPAQAGAVSRDKAWRLVMNDSGNIVVASGRARKDFRNVELQTFTLLADPVEGGGDALYSRFEVDCGLGRIRDSGTMAYSGARPIRAVGSQTEDRFVAPGRNAFYQAVRDYACTMVPQTILYREFDSLDSVVRDARPFVKRFD